MGHDRYVALGLARARAPWFTDVARWSTSAALPVEFVKCLSVDEARARLESGRSFSVLLADGALPGVDRDLVELARAAGAAVLIVDDPRVARDWRAIGAAEVLPDPLARDQLLSALELHATPVADVRARIAHASASAPGTWRGSFVAITGTGGGGSSTLAMATAQGLAGDPRNHGTVLLADLALDADQALLHDVGEVVPGLPELVDAHRLGHPSPDELAALTFDLPDRGYRLLLGLRRHRDWSALRRRSLDAALESLVRSARVVVADVEADLEGEQACGSSDVEDRNLLARAAASRADLVLVVSRPDPVGLHRMIRMLDAFREIGVEAARLQPVVNRAPRSPRARAELSGALAQLVASALRDEGLPNPLFIGERRNLGRLHHDVTPLPEAMCRPLAATVTSRLDTLGPRAFTDSEPVPVAVGSLGHWSAESELGS
jgi:hypothetical protein